MMVVTNSKNGVTISVHIDANIDTRYIVFSVIEAAPGRYRKHFYRTFDGACTKYFTLCAHYHL